ncbi:hypothetical protein BDW22DRAFT_1355894 [Trametopsis cervina]|nr:hypothetical protein BDW22DRAFT_1355894 [Trametopsis cervina]
MLRLSGSAPLHISISYVYQPTTPPKRTLDLFLQHVIDHEWARLQELDLRGQDVATLTSRFVHCKQPLPSLNYLSIVNTHGYVTIPLSFLAKRCYALRRLLLAGAMNITAHESPPAAFQASTTLIIADPASPAPSGDCYSVPPYPRLVLFTAKKKNPLGTAVVRLPTTTSIVDFIYGLPQLALGLPSQSGAPGPSSYFSYIPEYTAQIPRSTIRRLLSQLPIQTHPARAIRVSVDPGNELMRLRSSIELCVEYRPRVDDGTSRMPCPDVSFTIYEISYQWRTFCTYVGMDDLVELTVEDDTAGSVVNWDLWRRAIGIRRLRVIGAALFTLIPLLNRDLPSNDAHLDHLPLSVSTPVLFPLLEELCIIERRGEPGRLGDATEFIAGPVEQLLACLRARRLCGIPVRSLKLPPRFLDTHLAIAARIEVTSVTESNIDLY